MNAILIYVLVGIISAVVALCAYIVIRKIVLKGQKEEIIRKAELEAESIITFAMSADVIFKIITRTL